MADALFSIANDHRWPEQASSFTNQAISASDAGLGFTFQPNTADAITHLGFRYGVRTGTPPVQKVTLYGVTAAGIPDGSDVGGGSPTLATFTPPADATWDGLWKWVQLTNAFTPTRGQFLASAIEYSSGTVDASNNSTYARSVTHLATSASTGFPCVQVKTTGTWAKNAGLPCFGYRTANGRYGYIIQSAFSTNITTTGNRSAMKFNLPSTWGSTFKVSGANCVFQVGASGAVTMTFGLWNAAGTLLASATYDMDYFRTSGTQSGLLLFADTTLPTLSFGTDYYIGFESISSSSIGMRGHTLAEAADRSAYPNGTNRCFSSWNGSAWSDDTTIMPLCDLVFADFTVSGGSGMLYVPNLEGV